MCARCGKDGRWARECTDWPCGYAGLQHGSTGTLATFCIGLNIVKLRECGCEGCNDFEDCGRESGDEDSEPGEEVYTREEVLNL